MEDEAPSPRPGANSASLESDFRGFVAVLVSQALPDCQPATIYEPLLRTDPGSSFESAPGMDTQMIDSCCHGDAAKTVFEGVPVYPLYKQLAAVVCEYVLSGRLREMPPISELTEDTTLNEKIDLWLEKVQEQGSALKEDLQRVKYRLHVQDEFFRQLRDGSKVVEGRCSTGNYKHIQSGDVLLFNDVLLLQVKEVKPYESFYKMLDDEGLHNVLPGIDTLSEGVQVYRRFYTEEVEKEGVLAIHVARTTFSEPLKRVHALLKDLQIEGIMFLLGLRFTKGTAVPAFPPPRSALLTSFLSKNSDTSSASKLTTGGRALAKHVHRSSTGWWGKFTGSEMKKNQVALDVICRVINTACWMNIHYLPHSLTVFEIRVKDGYGARWSSDGTEFRGFLEPPMKEGHALKWRH